MPPGRRNEFLTDSRPSIGPSSADRSVTIIRCFYHVMAAIVHLRLDWSRQHCLQQCPNNCHSLAGRWHVSTSLHALICFLPLGVAQYYNRKWTNTTLLPVLRTDSEGTSGSQRCAFSWLRRIEMLRCFILSLHRRCRHALSVQESFVLGQRLDRRGKDKTAVYHTTEPSKEYLETKLHNCTSWVQVYY